MNYFDRLQKSIDFIEERITDELPLEEIANVACCSLFHFHRIFQAVVGDSVKEYIRKRRLSMAGRELARSGMKVIDAALKYGYETPESFTKAFKKFHRITPVLCRRNGTYRFREKAFVHIFETELLEGGRIMNYKIVEKDSFRIVGRELRVRNDNGDNFRLIPKFWEQCEKEGIWQDFAAMKNVVNRNNCYGMCMDFDGINTFSYIICVEVSGVESIPDGMTAKTVPSQKYAVFTAKGKMPDAIQQTWKDIHQKWFPSSGFERVDGPDFEVYDTSLPEGAECSVDIYVPVK